MIKIDLKIIDSRISTIYPLPNHATSGSAGFDLRACINDTVLQPNTKILVPTGIAIHIKDLNLAAIILPRSGLSYKFGIILSNTIGLIDSDYQGQIMVPLWNCSNKSFTISPGIRIAQLLFIYKPAIEFNIVNEFETSKRGEMGFGHSGLK